MNLPGATTTDTVAIGDEVNTARLEGQTNRSGSPETNGYEICNPIAIVRTAIEMELCNGVIRRRRSLLGRKLRIDISQVCLKVGRFL